MKVQSRMALSLVLGLALGVTSVEILRAQVKPPAYYVAQIELTGDKDAYIKNYASLVQATIEPFGGRFLSRGGKVTPVEGDPPRPRIAIITFDSVEKAQAWYNSPAYQKIAPVRQSLAKTNSFIVEGLAN